MKETETKTITNPPRIRTNFAVKTLQKLPQVLTLYNDYHLTVQEVSEALEMSAVTVSNLIKQYGNGLRPKHAKYHGKVKNLGKDIEIMYYEQFKSTRQIATKLGVQASFVRNYLNTLSDGTRTGREACLLRTTDDYREKIKVTQLGELNNGAKLTVEKVLQIRKKYEVMLQEGYSKHQAQISLANKYGVKRPTISDVVLRKTWKHI